MKDHDPKISRLALQILDEACDEVGCLESLIAHKPQFLPEMGPLGKILWLRLASLERGFAYLSELDFIDKEIQYWQKEGCVKYVLDLETNLTEAFFPSAQKRTDSDQKYVIRFFFLKEIAFPLKNLTKKKKKQSDSKSVFLSPHFYGELAKTSKGCEVLIKHNIVSQLMKSLNENTLKPLEYRAVLWALGHIGSSSGGFALLEKEDFLKSLMKLVDTSPCLSIRG